MEREDSRESSVRYRYAIGANDAIVDVHSLTEMSRHQLGTLFCPGCGAELIPKLGQVVAKHFAHASESPCSGTSYLHKLAQRAFAISYRAALTRNAPFWLELSRPTRCTHFESAIGHACESEEKTEVDLCAWFPTLEVEKGHAGFVADILLQAPSGAVVFVEIAVTHRCEPEKIALGERIIEIAIESEGRHQAHPRAASRRHDEPDPMLQLQSACQRGQFVRRAMRYACLCNTGLSHWQEPAAQDDSQ